MVALQDYFILQRKMLKIGGLSLETQRSSFYNLYCVFICGLFISYFLFLVLDIVLNYDDFDLLIDSVYHMLAILTILSKFMVTTMNSKKLNRTLQMLELGVFAPNLNRGGLAEKIWVTQCVTNLNRLIIVAWISPLVALGVAIVATMVIRISRSDPQQWQLPFGKFSIFNPTRSPNFELAWLYQGIMFPMGTVIYLGTDLIVVGVLSHIALQFRMLQNSIKRIVQEKKVEAKDAQDTCFTTIWENLAKRLKENVVYHMAILDLAKQFEDILNVLILYNYLAVLIALVCMMYHSSLYTPADPRFQKDAALVMALAFSIFFTSYFGNEVTVESKMVLSACYDVNFVGTDVRLQKGLCLIMCRSQKATTFTIGKFADLSLILFVAVVRASVSYYMVLLKVNTKT